MSKLIDLTGQKFGRLTVVERTDDYVTPKGRHYVAWLCKCTCGNKKIITAANLHHYDIVSCGCYKNEKSDNKKTNKKLISIWKNMKQRCLNPNCKCYKFYGGRDIKICNEWLHSCKAFCNWARGNGFKENLTLDRINVNGDYEPDNCRWVTMKEQANNTRKNHCLTYNGKTQTMTQWSEETGISQSKISDRITKLHWAIEKALNTP